MNWLWLVSYFFGGVFAANAILTLSPARWDALFKSLCKTTGQGLSSATVNVLWGFFNAVVGMCSSRASGSFDLRATGTSLRSPGARCSSASFQRVTSAVPRRQYPTRP